MRKAPAGSLLAFAALGIAAALLSYAWLGLHSRYLADDFGFAAGVRDDGFWRSQLLTYEAWSGRISSTFISSIVALGGTRTVPFLPAVWIVLLCACFALVPAASRRWRIALAMTFVWAICDGAADIFESLYWPTGAVAYFVPLAFVALAAYAAQRSQATLAALCAALAATSSEMLAVIAFAAAAITACFHRARASFAATAGAAAGLLIVLLSPGNAGRRMHYAATPPVLELMAKTATQSVEYATRFVVRAGVQSLLILILFALAGSVIRARALPAWITAAAAIVIANAISVHTGYGYPPARGLTVVDAFVFAAIAITGARMRNVLARRETLAWIIVAILVVTGPLVSILRNAQVMPSARRFAEQWDAADRQLRRGKGKGTIVVDVPVRVGNLYYVTPNPAHPSNVAVAHYYGVDGVVVRPSR